MFTSSQKDRGNLRASHVDFDDMYESKDQVGTFDMASFLGSFKDKKKSETESLDAERSTNSLCVDIESFTEQNEEVNSCVSHRRSSSSMSLLPNPIKLAAKFGRRLAIPSHSASSTEGVYDSLSVCHSPSSSKSSSLSNVQHPVNFFASDGIVSSGDLIAEEPVGPLSIVTKVFGMIHPSVLKATQHLVTLSLEEGNYEMAIMHAKRALYIMERLVMNKTHGKDTFSHEVYLQLELLATIYLDADMHSEAELLLRRCLLFASPLHDPDNQIHIRCMNRLRELLSSQGRREEMNSLEVSMSESTSKARRFSSTTATGVMSALSRRFRRTSLGSASTRMSSLATDENATIETLKRVYKDNRKQLFTAMRRMAAHLERKGNATGAMEVWETILSTRDECSQEASVHLAQDLLLMAKFCVRVDESVVAYNACEKAKRILNSPLLKGTSSSLLNEADQIQASVEDVLHRN